MQGSFRFITDTATMCVYDLGELQHRLDDTPDWWSNPEDELAEVNAGNCLFFNLSQDGVYEVNWIKADEDLEAGGPMTEVLYFRVSVGSVFVGAADDVTGGGLEPDHTCEGVILELEPGSYACMAQREGNQIRLALSRSETDTNRREDLIRM
ncbi:DUF6386 family protein [Brevibacillus laterosporus]|uniref:DUF6386 family protein n=1 Tax=Brevibacillus laterosporus TaxID=1465 RepID=UPI0018CD3329|nr:DUF6386 family protein [Brevibacillus laterosporus]MBG9787453.1 hypothetical protein [Brevibacillus laterosporus]